MAKSNAGRPNILVVMSDQHNARVSGPYGDSLVRTPNMDRLANEGTVFERCYTPSPVCVPARMSFVSGRRPSENGVTDNPDILSSAILTWPERLREYGYHTALVGRMHFQGPDQWHGFETTFEELRHWRDGRPVRHQEVTENVPNGGYWSPRSSIEELAGSGSTFVHYRDEVVCDRGLQFLREQAELQRGGGTAPTPAPAASASPADRARGAARPFAAVIGFYNPHPPYIGKKEIFDYYYEKVEVPDDRLSSMPDYLADYYATFRDWENPKPMASEAKRRALAAYYANVEHADTQLGRILEVLDQTGLAENTLVIYTSDHGDFIGRRGAWSKMAMYDDTARVPCIARLPGTIEAGRRSEHLLNLRDFGNTFCEIAGAPTPSGSDAPSRWGLFTGSGDPGPNETESEIVQSPSPFGQKESSALKMVIRWPWKLWCYQIGVERHFSLFHLENDPGETIDLSGRADLDSLMSDLTNRLFEGWDPEFEIELAARRRADRAELEKVWMKDWLHAGHGFPEGYDAEVDSPHARGG
ncbi:MAG: sulfatase-like hydrolase/transferase [Spirochaetales bacterium]